MGGRHPPVRSCPGVHLPKCGGGAWGGPWGGDSGLPGGHPGVGYPGDGGRTRWPPAWRGTASGWRLGPQCLRGAGAPFEPRTPGSLLAQPHPTMGAATPHPLGDTPPRGRRRVGRRARRGGRAPRTGGRPRSTRWIPRATTTTGGTPETTARTRRGGNSHPCPGRVPGL